MAARTDPGLQARHVRAEWALPFLGGAREVQPGSRQLCRLTQSCHNDPKDTDLMFRLWFIADVVGKIGYAGGPGSCPRPAWGAFEAGDVQLEVANVKGKGVRERGFALPLRRCGSSGDKPGSLRAVLVLVDVHAETTSEKQAVGYLLEGRAQAVT